MDSRSTDPSPPRAAPGTMTPVDGLATLSFVIHGLLERRAADVGLSMIQTRLLGVLRDRQPTINELAGLLELDKSSVSGLVDRAERRHLVTRVPSTTDGRSVLVTLTDAGRSLVAEVSTCFEADVSAMLAHLSPSGQAALARQVSRLLVARAEDRGVDLFATITTDAAGRPVAGQ